jgi:hypothetical protein
MGKVCLGIVLGAVVVLLAQDEVRNREETSGRLQRLETLMRGVQASPTVIEAQPYQLPRTGLEEPVLRLPPSTFPFPGRTFEAPVLIPEESPSRPTSAVNPEDKTA